MRDRTRIEPTMTADEASAGRGDVAPETPGDAPPADALPGPDVAPQTPGDAPRPAGFGFWSAVGLCAIWLFLFGATLLELRYLGRPGWLRLQPLAEVLAAQALATAGVLWFGLGRWGLARREVLSLRPVPLPLLPGVLLASLGLPVLVLRLLEWLPLQDAYLRSLLEMFSNSGWPLLFFLGVVAAPVVEELLFRGLLLGALRQRYGDARAIWLSAIIFAALHGNSPQVVGAFVFGLGAAWLLVRTGSLLPGMLAHATWNLAAAFLLPALLRAAGYLPRGGQLPELPLWPVAVATLLAALGASLLRHQLRTPLPAPAGPDAPAAPARRTAPWRLAAVLGLPLLLVLGTAAAARRALRVPEATALAGCYRLTGAAGLGEFGDARGSGPGALGAAREPGLALRLTAARHPISRRGAARFVAQAIGGEGTRAQAVGAPPGAAPTGDAPAAARRTRAGVPVDTAYWFPLRGDSVRIVLLRDDMSGAVLRLRARGGALAGTLTSYREGGVATGAATAVSGRRGPCPQRPRP